MTRKLISATVIALSIIMVSYSTTPKYAVSSNNNSDTTTVDQNKYSRSYSETNNAKPIEDAKINNIKLSIYTII